MIRSEGEFSGDYYGEVYIFTHILKKLCAPTDTLYYICINVTGKS